jgi:hypothetical protein
MASAALSGSRMRKRQVLPSSAYTLLFGLTAFSTSERISVSMPSSAPFPTNGPSVTPDTNPL